jgi:hypothetical protein
LGDRHGRQHGGGQDSGWEFPAAVNRKSVTLDHDDIGLNQSNIMNVIDSKSLERDAGGKPGSTFPHPALGQLETAAAWFAEL